MSAAWAKKNPEKCQGYRKKWEEKTRYRENNKENIAKYAAEYWAKNRHKLIPQSLLRAARRRAKVSGLECTITVDDIVVPERCPLLDIVLMIGNGAQNPQSPSLDRIDNSKGYVSGNVWVISLKANMCKGALSADEIIQIGTRLKTLGGAHG